MSENGSPKKKRTTLLWVGIIIGGFILLIGLFITFGLIFQKQNTKKDFTDFPARGEMVDVGDHKLHINCQGEGSPTVVVDAGNGDFSLGWSLVQPQVALHTRICTYDRAGYGWSESGPNPRDGKQVVSELHMLLVNAGIQPPFILVGHSIGGYHVRLFADSYPEEVVGMVLVDAGHEEQLTRLPAEYNKINQQQQSTLAMLGFLSRFGVLRLMPSSSADQFLPPFIKQLSPDDYQAYKTLISHPNYFIASLSELKALEATCADVTKLSGLDDLPIVVLTAENSIDPETLEAIGLSESFSVEKIQATWLALQEELAKLSTNNTHVLVKDTGHAIHLDQPEVITNAILEILTQVR